MLRISCALSERQIRADLRQALFPKGRVRCTSCGSFVIRSIRKEKRFHCSKCRKKFSLLSHTWMKHVKIPLATFVILLFCWMKEYAVAQAEDMTGLSIPTVYKYYRLFRLNVVKSVPFEPQKNVQVDEAYFGQFRKRANYYHGFKKYEVCEKVCVAGIGCPSNGQLAAKVITGVRTRPIQRFIRERVPANVKVYSDGSPIYNDLKRTHEHESQTHDLGFHNAYYIESCWSWMKRKLFKQYHHMTRKYAEEYVSELTWRFNTRKSSKNALTYLQKSL